MLVVPELTAELDLLHQTITTRKVNLDIDYCGLISTLISFCYVNFSGQMLFILLFALDLFNLNRRIPKTKPILLPQCKRDCEAVELHRLIHMRVNACRKFLSCALNVMN